MTASDRLDHTKRPSPLEKAAGGALSIPKSPSESFAAGNRIGSWQNPMVGLVNLLLGYVWSCFQSHERVKAEIVILRHQLNILR